MPTAISLTTLTVPVSAIPTTLVSTILSAPTSAIPTAPILIGPGKFSSFHSLPHSFIINSLCLLHGLLYHASRLLPGPIPTAPPQFEVGSSSATVPDPVGEAAAIFTRFDQLEVNDLNPMNFWGSGPPYVDFHGFRVPEDCASHLEAVYSSRGDFMQGFRLGHSAREHFLKLLGSLINDIEHNFIDTVSTKRILQ